MVPALIRHSVVAFIFRNALWRVLLHRFDLCMGGFYEFTLCIRGALFVLRVILCFFGNYVLRFFLFTGVAIAIKLLILFNPSTLCNIVFFYFKHIYVSLFLFVSNELWGFIFCFLGTSSIFLFPIILNHYFLIIRLWVFHIFLVNL